MGPVCDLRRVEMYRKLRNLQRELDLCPKQDGHAVVQMHAAKIESEIARVRQVLKLDGMRMQSL